VIYCHGNCGSRCDALDAVQVLLPFNITVLAFDFSGSGLSDGKVVFFQLIEKVILFRLDIMNDLILQLLWIIYGKQIQFQGLGYGVVQWGLPHRSCMPVRIII